MYCVGYLLNGFEVCEESSLSRFVSARDRFPEPCCVSRFREE